MKDTWMGGPRGILPFSQKSRHFDLPKTHIGLHWAPVSPTFLKCTQPEVLENVIIPCGTQRNKFDFFA